MGEPVRIQVRCPEETKNRYSEAAGAVGMTYGEFALYASLFILENRDDFRKFSTKEMRRREKRR